MQLSVLCACLLLVATAPTALAQHAFVQSVFNTDARIPAPYRSYDDKVLRTKAFSLIFTGTEVGNYLIWGTDAETGAPSSQGIEQVREVAAAMKQAAEETGRPFIGHFSFPRLPGFFWPDELALQPDDWRPRSLKSDGSPWVRYPPLSTDNHSKHAYNGWVLDITNQSAVEQLLTNLAIVFDQDGPEDVSVGPIYGYVMIDETTLGGLYRADKETDVADPPQDGFATRMRLGNGRKHFDIWWDEDPYYSHLLGPKRAIPLFSESARDSFAAYAAAQGHPEIDTLPADRNEFNHVPDVITLPDHVEFVALSNSTHWGLWTDWCYATWSQFLEKVAREISIAQRGNPDYRGIMLFQTPMMISFRDSGQLPITFQYRNASGQMVTETTTLANHPEFDRINPVNSGMDGDYLLQSPWIAGLLYETAALHIGHEILEPLDEDLAQEFAYQSDRFKYYWMAQGALAREVAHANDKVFGAFVKTRWFEPDSHASRFLPPADFARKFEHVIEPLGGEIVSSIGTRFIAASMIDRFEVDPVKPPSEGQLQAVLADHDGELQDTWLAKIGAFRANFPLGFSEHPWPHTAEHGQATALHIQAAGGNPDPNSGYEYRWQDSPTADGPWRFTPTGGVDGIQDVSGPSLAIPNPQFDGGEGDTGNNRFYRCRIRDLSGQAGQRFSPAARLTVLAPANPPLTVSTPAPATVTEGSEATFAVTASGGTGTYTYRWYYSATSPTSGFTKLLNSTSNIAGATQTTLSVDPTSGADEGWYKCRVRDGSFATTGLEVYSQPAQLTVEAGSTSDLAVSDPASLNVDVGAPATFSVVASGGTSPYTYRWYFSATSPTSGFVKLLNTAANISGATQPTLQVDPTSAADEGWYKVRVRDADHGTTGHEVYSQPARLTVGAAADPTCGGLLQEAEDGVLSGQFVLGTDPLASGGAFVHVPEGTSANGVAGGPDKVSFCFRVPVDGNYRLKGRHYSPSGGSDSFFVGLGDPAQETFNWVPRPLVQWAWDAVNDFGVEDPIDRFFAAGDHRIDVFLREDGTRLDALELKPIDVTCDDLSQEAEAGLISGGFQIVNDANASGGSYVHVPDGSASGLGSPGDPDRIRLCVRVPEAGVYRLRGGHYVPSGSADSFWVQLDGLAGEIYNWVPRPFVQWATDDVNDFSVEDPIDRNLAAGSHLIDVFLREDGARLDFISLELQ